MDLPIRKYFRLNSECHFVKGANRGAIYNLLSGDIISLEPNITKILRACEMDKSIDEIISSIGNISLKECLDLFEKLIKIKAGMFYERPIYIKKYGDIDSYKKTRTPPTPPILSLGFIELTNLCELECFFCKGNGIKLWHKGCMGCSRWPINNKTKRGVDEWGEVLSQLNDLECRDLMIIGGNPLLVEDKLMKVSKQARSLKFQRIFLGTNGMYLSENIIRFLKKYEIYPLIQVFSYKSKEYELITGKCWSFDVLTENLRKLKENGLKFSITILVSHITQNNIKEIREFFKTFSPENIFLDYLYPISNNLSDLSSAYTEKLVISKKNLPRTSLEDFCGKRDYNSCLNGKIAVTTKGDVLPCIMMRDDIIGNINESSLQELFAGKKMDLYWDLSREKIETCIECEYRYACPDCRALEKSATGNLYGRKYCAYNPKKGKWIDNFSRVL